jgi:hypothetical protein
MIAVIRIKKPEIRYARSKKTFPGKVRRTADPSAALGMTKGTVVAGQRALFITLGGPATTNIMKNALGPSTTFHITTTLSFVIPSAAEGSAVLRTFPGNVFFDLA